MEEVVTMKVNDFIKKAKDIATNYKTLYVMGCFGSPLTEKNKKRFTTNHSYNKSAIRRAMINDATPDTFGFDCVCLIKGILWGWNGNKKHVYGGATYKANGVGDMDADTMIKVYCKDVSTNFNKVDTGHIVWMPGHVGIYVGNGEVVECTPSFKNKVQITKLKGRGWEKHGKLRYIDYSKTEPKQESYVTKIAKEVIQGKWGNGKARKDKLAAAGYDYKEIQAEVNRLLK